MIWKLIKKVFSQLTACVNGNTVRFPQQKFAFNSEMWF